MTSSEKIPGWRLFGVYLTIALVRQVCHDVRNLVRWARTS